MTELAKNCFRFVARYWYRICSERSCDYSKLAIILILLVTWHGWPNVAEISSQEALGLGHVDPSQGPGIGRFVRGAVGQSTLYLCMYRIDPLDRCGRSVAVTKCRNGDEARRPLEAAVHILAEVRVIENTLERMRVEHLQHQSADPATHHTDQVGVDHSDRCILFEQRGV